MATNNIKAGRAYVELGADRSQLKRDLAAATSVFNKFGASIQSIGLQIGAVFSGGIIAASVFKASRAFADAGSKLDDLANRSGASVEALSELALAAQMSDTSIESVGDGIRKMQVFLVKAAKGGKEANATLATLGVNLEDIAKLSPEDQFTAFAEAISKIDDPALKTSMAMEVFSKTGAELIPLLGEGQAGIEAFRKEARRLGLQMSGADAANAAAYGDALDKVNLTMAAILRRVGSALAPMFTKFAEAIASVTGWVSQFVDRNRALVAIVAPVAAALGAAGGLAIAAGLAFQLFSFALGPAIVAATTFALSLGGTVAASLIALAPIAFAVGAAIGGLTATMYGLGVTWTEVANGIASAWRASMSAIGTTFAPVINTVSSFVNTIVEAFAWAYSGATQYFGAIGTALASGNLQGAANVALTGLKNVFRMAFNSIYGYYLSFAEGFANAWDGWTFALSRTFIKMLPYIESAFLSTTTFLANLWTNFTSGIMLTWNTSIGFIQKAWIRLKGLFDSDLNVNAEVDAIDQRTNAANSATAAAGVNAITQRERANKAAQDKIDYDQSATVAELDRAQAAKRTARQAETDKLAAEAQAELDQAKEEYAKALTSVETFNPEDNSRKRKFGFDPDELGNADELSKAIAKANNSINVKGTFSALEASRLGGGGMDMNFARRTAVAVEKTVRELEELNAKKYAYGP